MVFEARFSRRDCTPCPLRPRCTKAKREPRIIGLQAQDYEEALQAARKRQSTAAFRLNYAGRAGIEGTHGQAIRRCDLRQCRYIGLAKTRLQHIITSRLSLSIWHGSARGGPTPREPKPGARALLPCITLPEVDNQFATNIKILIGGSLRARTLSAQKDEARIACKVINRMTSLSMPISRKVA
jgi:hypothetical protein